MIEKDWRLSQDKEGNLCIYHKNPTSKEWEIHYVIKKPSYNSDGTRVAEKRGCFSKKKMCSIM